MKKVFASLVLITAIVTSCSKTNEEVLSRSSRPDTTVAVVTCDTVNMKFAANVQPILIANCTSCHNKNKANGGVMLDTYSAVQAVATDNSTDNSSFSTLVSVITHRSGYPAMPYNKPKLAECDINKIRAWIKRGALNN